MTVHRSLRRIGFEDEKNDIKSRGINDKKLLESISRSKARVQEYALCNEWQFFVTFTLDPKKYDRYDLQKYKKDFGQFINNYNRGRETKVKYVIIPEKHQNGAWHMHAIFMGFNETDLERFTYNFDWPKTKKHPDGAIPKYIKKKLDKDIPIYFWKEYLDKFGYNVLDVIRDKNKVSSYILKYFTKSLSKSIHDLNSNLYYPSHGLKRKIELKRGYLTPNEVTTVQNEKDETIEIYDYSNIKFDYETEHIKVKWFDMSEENMKLIQSIRKVNYNSFMLFLQQKRKLDRNKIKIVRNARLNYERMNEFSLQNSYYLAYIITVNNIQKGE